MSTKEDTIKSFKEFSSVQANFKIVVNKIKMDVIMDKIIIDENPTDDVYKI